MLKGKRVVLRAIEREDLPTLCAFNNDLEVEVAGNDEPPLPLSLARIQADYTTKWSGGGRDRPWFAIEADNKMIGHCGLALFGEVHRHCYLGIAIGDKEYWGKGYGREAVLLLLDWAFRYRNLNRVCLAVLSSNVRAHRCYLACGFVEETRLRQHIWSNGQYVDFIHMAVLREEWEARNSSQDEEN